MINLITGIESLTNFKRESASMLQRKSGDSRQAGTTVRHAVFRLGTERLSRCGWQSPLLDA